MFQMNRQYKVIKMKKSVLILTMVLFMVVSIHAQKKFTVTLSGNYLAPSDGNYKEIYGEGKFFPEIKAGFKVFKDIYIWTGYGYLTAKGKTVSTLTMDAESSQHFISFGAGYIKKISKPVGIKIELGGFSVKYEENSMDNNVTGSVLGFRIEGGLVFNIGKTIFAELTLGYLNASDTVEDATIKFGGFKTGIGLGIKF